MRTPPPPNTTCPCRALQTASLDRADPGMVAALQKKLDKEECGHQAGIVLRDLLLEWKKKMKVSGVCN
jgi:hypothetical protein